MYTNQKYEQGGNDIGISSLSWRAQNRDLNGYNLPINRQQYISPASRDVPGIEALHPKSLLDSRDLGPTADSRLRDHYPGAESRLREISPGNLSWRGNEVNQAARTDRFPTEPDERYNDIEASRLSWRGSQSGSQSSDIRSPHKQLPDDRYSEESRLSWRAAQSGATLNPPLDNIPPRPLLGTNDKPPEISRPKSLLDDHYNGNSSQLSWRAGQPDDRLNSDALRPRPLLDERLPIEASRTKPLIDDRLPLDSRRPKSLIDERYDDMRPQQLSWRAAQSGEPRNTHPSTIHHSQSATELGRRFEDVKPGRPEPYPTKPAERINGFDRELSWRKGAAPGADNIPSLASRSNMPPDLGNRFEDTKAGAPERSPAKEAPSDMKPLDNSRLKSLLDEPLPNQLSWRAAQSILNSIPPADSLRPATDPDRRPADSVNAERLSWRAANAGSNNNNSPRPLLPPEALDRRDNRVPSSDRLSWRAANAGSTFNEQAPRSLMPPEDRRLDDLNSAGLSWRAKEMGSNNMEPPKPLLPAEGPDRRFNDVNTAGLSWRAKEMGSNNMEHPKPLFPAERPDRRYNDVNTAGLSWRSRETDIRPNDIEASALSWRSANSGPNGAPKPLIPNEGLDNSRPHGRREAGMGGSLLGKTRYSDMYPEKLRDADLSRSSIHPKIFY